MRSSAYRSSRPSSLPWKWIIIGWVILLLVIWSRYIGTEEVPSGSSLQVQLWSGWVASITSLGGKERVLDQTDRLYSYDSHISVKAGSAEVWAWIYNVSVDKWGEIGYTGWSGAEQGIFSVTKGRIWAEPKKEVGIKMKNMNISLKDGDIILAEQQSQVYSILYALSGSIYIEAWGRTYTLEAGKRIMVSQSDLATSTMTLDSLSGPIDDGIKQNAFFLAHGWESILASIKQNTINTTNSWETLRTLSGVSIANGTKSIEITYPTDGMIISTTKVDISGKLLAKNIKKITVNGYEAILSQVNESFSIKWFPLGTDISDLVYKSYDPAGNMLERGVITLYTKNGATGSDKLVPTTFPTNDKNYRITSPSENPYRTTERAVTVSGVIPKDTVEYITVNGYKLKKFTPKSATWYYYANRDYETMAEGFNLYEIKFYSTNNTLLATQVFTIIKESSTVSWEK